MSRYTSSSSNDCGSADGLCGKAAVACLKNRASFLIAGEHFENQRTANLSSECLVKEKQHGLDFRPYKNTYESSVEHLASLARE
jgi:hypothetical protein